MKERLSNQTIIVKLYYSLNKKMIAEKELVKMTTDHSVNIKTKALKNLNSKMVEYVGQVLAWNSMRFEIMYLTAGVNICASSVWFFKFMVFFVTTWMFWLLVCEVTDNVDEKSKDYR